MWLHAFFDLVYNALLVFGSYWALSMMGALTAAAILIHAFVPGDKFLALSIAATIATIILIAVLIKQVVINSHDQIEQIRALKRTNDEKFVELKLLKQNVMKRGAILGHNLDIDPQLKSAINQPPLSFIDNGFQLLLTYGRPAIDGGLLGVTVVYYWHIMFVIAPAVVIPMYIGLALAFAALNITYNNFFPITPGQVLENEKTRGKALTKDVNTYRKLDSLLNDNEKLTHSTNASDTEELDNDSLPFKSGPFFSPFDKDSVKLKKDTGIKQGVIVPIETITPQSS